MDYLTESQLLAERDLHVFERRHYIKEAASQAQLSIFLSHSHKDRSLVEGLIAHFATLGIRIYVDWNDSSMPRITSRATAAKIKQRMGQCSLFVVFATQNAIESKWVPWETGVADQMKGEARISVIPVADASGRYKGAEYLQLYQTMAIGPAGRLGLHQAETDTYSGGIADYFRRFAA